MEKKKNLTVMHISVKIYSKSTAPGLIEKSSLRMGKENSEKMNSTYVKYVSQFDYWVHLTHISELSLAFFIALQFGFTNFVFDTSCKTRITLQDFQ